MLGPFWKQKLRRRVGNTKEDINCSGNQKNKETPSLFSLSPSLSPLKKGPHSVYLIPFDVTSRSSSKTPDVTLSCCLLFLLLESEDILPFSLLQFQVIWCRWGRSLEIRHLGVAKMGLISMNCLYIFFSNHDGLLMLMIWRGKGWLPVHRSRKERPGFKTRENKNLSLTS